MNKVLFLIGLGVAYYFLYQYNYNEAKNAMSLMAPEFLSVAHRVYASTIDLQQLPDVAPPSSSLFEGAPNLPPDKPTPFQELVSDIGKNMTYDRVIELQEENPKTCIDRSEIENITLKAECEFIIQGGGYQIIEEHEAQLEAAVEDRKLAFLQDMGIEEKVNGVLNKCKNQSIANTSVLEYTLLESIHLENR